jgi:hypothetical protein
LPSPLRAGSSSLAHPPRPERAGPYLRFDHSGDEALRAIQQLRSEWGGLERGRRARLVLTAPALLLAAAACPVIDRQTGFGILLMTWFAPLFVAAALVTLAATRPPGRSLGAGLASLTPRRLATWWRPPVWRQPLASCHELIAAFADPSARVCGWIDLTGIEQAGKRQFGGAGAGQAAFYRDAWCRLSIRTRRQRFAVRAVEERLVGPGSRRRRWRAQVVVIAVEPYGPAPRLRVPSGPGLGRLQVLHARAHRHRLALALRTPRRRLAWSELAEILRTAGAPGPLS